MARQDTRKALLTTAGETLARQPSLQDPSAHCQGYSDYISSEASQESIRLLVSWFLIYTLHFLCRLAHPCAACLSFQIVTIPAAPFHVRGRWRNVLLESNSMSVSRLQGLLSCSQMSPSCKQSLRFPPSGRLSTAGLSQKRLWNVLWKEEMVKCHLTEKRKLTQQTAQFAFLVFSSMITSMSATSVTMELATKTGLVWACGKWRWAKMNIQAVQQTSAPLGMCELSCCPILKLPFRPPISLMPGPSPLNCAHVMFILTLLKIWNVCICLLSRDFFKPSINSFWWWNFHNGISWVARKWLFFHRYIFFRYH